MRLLFVHPMSVVLVALCAAGAGLAQSDKIADLRVAADRGEARAQEALGVAHYWGAGVEQDYALALSYLGDAAAAGRRRAIALLADMYQNAAGVDADPGRARTLYLEAANRGDAYAQAMVGWIYGSDGGEEQQIAEALMWLEAAAAQGLPYALRYLGEIYREGRGVTADAAAAERLGLRAAELGDAQARHETAKRLLERPENEDSSRKRGAQLLRLAAEQGYLQAQIDAALSHFYGSVLPLDGTEAVKWFNAAAESGAVAAKLWLAQAYATGFGVAADPRRADSLFAEALAELEPNQINNFAWMLAVSERSRDRDGNRAVQLMEALLADPTQRVPTYLDTLAAAYAEAGHFADAVRIQREAIDAAPSDLPEQIRIDYRARLELYQRQQPYREELIR